MQIAQASAPNSGRFTRLTGLRYWAPRMRPRVRINVVLKGCVVSRVPVVDHPNIRTESLAERRNSRRILTFVAAPRACRPPTSSVSSGAGTLEKRGEAIDSLPEVDRLRGDVNANCAARIDHGSPRRARRTSRSFGPGVSTGSRAVSGARNGVSGQALGARTSSSPSWAPSTCLRPATARTMGIARTDRFPTPERTLQPTGRS
jgi:hypothetical protein